MRRGRSECLAPHAWTEFLDGAASGLAREAYQRHVERCDACRRKYAALSLAVRAAGELAREDVTPPPGLHVNVKRRLAWDRGRAARRRSAALWLPVAAGLLIAGLSLMLGRPALSPKDRSFVDLYAEAYMRAEGLATRDVIPLSTLRGEDLR